MSNTDFTDILVKLTVGDNSIRAAAEQHYDALKRTEGNIVVLSLLQTISDAAVPLHIRELAAVLLRRLLIENSDGIFRKMLPDE